MAVLETPGFEGTGGAGGAECDDDAAGGMEHRNPGLHGPAAEAHGGGDMHAGEHAELGELEAGGRHIETPRRARGEVTPGVWERRGGREREARRREEPQDKSECTI